MGDSVARSMNLISKLMPCISVTGEIEALRKFDESASARLQARQFTIVEPEEYFRSVRENVRKLLQVLERRK